MNATLKASSDIEEGSLQHDCYIKAENILKIDKKLAIKKIGKLSQKRFNQTIELFEEIIH